MAPAGSLHPQIDVDLNAVQGKILCGEYRPDANDQPEPLLELKTNNFSNFSQVTSSWLSLSPRFRRPTGRPDS